MIKQSLAKKTALLVLIPVTFQVILSIGLYMLYLEIEYYPLRAHHDKEVGDAVITLASDETALLRLLNPGKPGYPAVVVEGIDSQYVKVSQDLARLKTIWDNYAEKRGRLLHPLAKIFAPVNLSSYKEAANFLENHKKALDSSRLATETFVNQGSDYRTPVYRQALVSWANACTQAQFLMLGQDAAFGSSKERSLSRQGWLFLVIALAGVNLLVLFAIGLYLSFDIHKRLKSVLETNDRIARGEPLGDPLTGSDEIASLDCAFHDLSQSLHENLLVQQVIVENAQDLICSIDKDGRFMALNAASRSLLGCSPKELVGTFFLDVVEPSRAEDTAERLGRAARGDEQKPFETVLVRKNNSAVDVLCSPTVEAQAAVLYCVFQDISQKKASARLQRQVTELVCNELRLPLKEIDLFHDALMKGQYVSVVPEYRDKIDVLKTCTARMLTLVNDLDDSEKMEMGVLSLTKTNVAASFLFQQAIQAVAAQADKLSIKLVNRSNNCTVYGDAHRILQVLINLISNAIKFSPKESTITLTATELPEAISISVKDQGRGIPPFLLGSVFARFSQAQFADAKVKGGSGLGLSICKSLVELHGGDITVESELGVGTNFSFRIPKERGA